MTDSRHDRGGRGEPPLGALAKAAARAAAQALAAEQAKDAPPHAPRDAIAAAQEARRDDPPQRTPTPAPKPSSTRLDAAPPVEIAPLSGRRGGGTADVEGARRDEPVLSPPTRPLEAARDGGQTTREAACAVTEIDSLASALSRRPPLILMNGLAITAFFRSWRERLDTLEEIVGRTVSLAELKTLRAPVISRVAAGLRVATLSRASMERVRRYAGMLADLRQTPHLFALMELYEISDESVSSRILFARR